MNEQQLLEDLRALAAHGLIDVELEDDGTAHVGVTPDGQAVVAGELEQPDGDGVMVGDPIDPANKFLVSAGGGGVVLLLPPRPRQVLTEDEALTLAAWLVALVGDEERFAEILTAVLST